MQKKKSKRANSRSSHSPPLWIWNRKYLKSTIVPPRNSSIQDINVIWIPILFLRRLLILDSSDKLANIVSLDSHLLVVKVIMVSFSKIKIRSNLICNHNSYNGIWKQICFKYLNTQSAHFAYINPSLTLENKTTDKAITSQ